jgi:hypothetical protein
MPGYWQSPIYALHASLSKTVYVDVTSSVSPGLPSSRVVTQRLIPFLKSKGVTTVLDFGAGALRHTIPLLRAGFEVCAVEFEEGFQRPVSRKALKKAKRFHNFSALIWPKQFVRDPRRFDAALLVYVLQIMPVPSEREEVLRQLQRKLNSDTYLFYASRFDQITAHDRSHRVSDGYYRWPKREHHSFYREFTTEETREMMSRHGFSRIKSLSERGTDQMFLYSKGSGTWI